MRARRLSRRPSPATVMAAAALFISLGGAGYAATNGTFMLGGPNSAANTSGLSSGVTTGPTLALKNTGGKPALGLVGGAGASPFTVSSTRKVGKLNADLLDGLDAGAFARGATSFYSATDLHQTALPHTVAVLGIPNIGTVGLHCSSGSGGAVAANPDIAFPTGATGALREDLSGSPTGFFQLLELTNDRGSLIAGPGSGQLVEWHWDVVVGNYHGLVNVTAYVNSDNTCSLTAEAEVGAA